MHTISHPSLFPHRKSTFLNIWYYAFVFKLCAHTTSIEKGKLAIAFNVLIFYLCNTFFVLVLSVPVCLCACGIKLNIHCTSFCGFFVLCFLLHLLLIPPHVLHTYTNIHIGIPYMTFSSNIQWMSAIFFIIRNRLLIEMNNNMFRKED